MLGDAAGIEAGWWYASPATHVGYELVAAGMLIMAGGHDGSLARRTPRPTEPLDRNSGESRTLRQLGGQTDGLPGLERTSGATLSTRLSPDVIDGHFK
jgi:hypothetical protein